MIKHQDVSQRLRVNVRGAVQGVGFRPFIFRLATGLDLTGWVNNSAQGVNIEVEGSPTLLHSFLSRIESDRPPVSFIHSLESSFLDPIGFLKFEIRESESNGSKTAVVMPDIGTCRDCLREIFDPLDRRYLYPFTNCTNCGPRYSIITSLPYDRPNTTMRQFTMCPDCQAEYSDPLDRRFHAQPNACPACGPKLKLWDDHGKSVAVSHDALLAAAKAIRDGRIVAVKGIGGFHLMVDAANSDAIKLLRKRKHREEKPLALMMPSTASVETVCEVSDLERRALESPERPIVILKRKGLHKEISNLVAPCNPYLGCMLPYTPMHHLLMRELGFPVVATSGNLSDEPICIDENEAVKRLHGIADLFLVHDRPIVRHVDDSIVRIMAGRQSIVRRSRGFAPLPITVNERSAPTLAVGAHLKNTVAASSGYQIFLSQHIGDLETPQAMDAFRNDIDSIEDLYDISPELIACDEHPDYLSTRYARSQMVPRIAVQHHYAHILSCMAENDLEGSVLGIAWDGTGYGGDGTIWGGEFLRVDADGFTRAAHFRTFPLPGGDKAVREPRRVALGILFEELGDHVFSMDDLHPVKSFDTSELALIKSMLVKHINSPMTSSVGRLFDAVSSIIGLRQTVRFEGQAAMELEFAISALHPDERYDCSLTTGEDGCLVVDWGRAISDIIADTQSGVCRALISARFHNMLVETIISVAKRVGENAVALSGGCFQNKYLLERAVDRLREEGFRPYWHQRVPTNDGGIALGQTIAAARYVRQVEKTRASNDRRTALCA
ncbi:MAG TPA: carbamoyltransferase HypF [Pyrinomonadaceae bacterium]|nr:carbamoyltransferase HypF [Acidobacteriota bacterium]HQZ96853.1 carbamoyltransferase HypF [Pyrinomonadaceae bacterium]